jgi:hypothetical protein
MAGGDMRDLDYNPECTFYHGSSEPLSGTVLPGDETRWWNPMNHAEFLDPPWDDEDGADNGELAAELRTAYANIVYEAFLSSENREMRTMAENFGLSGLGSQVGILFVTDDLKYVERYGQAHEVDMKADGILDILFDENASRPSWMIIMRAGAPFPLKGHFSSSSSLSKAVELFLAVPCSIVPHLSGFGRQSWISRTSRGLHHVSLQEEHQPDGISIPVRVLIDHDIEASDQFAILLDRDRHVSVHLEEIGDLQAEIRRHRSGISVVAPSGRDDRHALVVILAELDAGEGLPSATDGSDREGNDGVAIPASCPFHSLVDVVQES